MEKHSVYVKRVEELEKIIANKKRMLSKTSEDLIQRAQVGILVIDFYTVM
jgi:hypothetical protein